ncbi:MAG: 3'-5' exonuclease [Acidimicrobiia bacterium]|nr:3'-5' exonuclease [Acidimicrobiia bacterium]
MSATSTAFTLLCESHTFVVIDVETCPSDDGNRIVSIAAATIRRGRQRGMWSTLVNPGVPITNSRYHDLADDDVSGARTFGAVAAELDALLADPDVVVVAHNAAFDVGVLHLEHARLGTVLRDVPVIDTMTLPKFVGHDTGRSRSLAALLTSFGLTNARPHDAASDAAATGQALLALLRIAANNGSTDLATVLTDTGTLATSSFPLGAAERMANKAERKELPAAHIATHTALLGATATDAELDDWVADALECAALRCDLLADKAGLATQHAAQLHRRLTGRLKAFAVTADAGQGGTLAGALNALAPHALNNRSARPWWKNHGPTLKALPRCHPSNGVCPQCRDGFGCPTDIAHQPIAALVCQALDGHVPKKRRRQVSGPDARCLVTDWARLGLPDLAGYAAWLVADAWAAEGNDSRSGTAIDQAVAAGAFDPRIICAYAKRLVAQGRHRDATHFVASNLGGRTTDPGWNDLDTWYARYLAEAAQAPTSKGPRPGASTRIARPAGRTRPRRFSV